MLNIGVTGHRNIDIKYIHKYRKEINYQLNKLKQNNIKIILYSALADGADRLVVHEAIKLNIEFIVVLPMSKDEYKKDFDELSKKEFDKLLNRSKKIINIPNNNKNFIRNIQYELSGHYISDNSELLFALWDGKDTGLQGGTSEIVKYHLKNEKEICHIKVDRNDILLKSHHDT
jgi:hypothetical protein